MKDKGNIEDVLIEALSKAGVKIKIGLEQQGHISTIEGMLDRHCTWDEINNAIGWAGDAACKSYIRYLRNKNNAKCIWSQEEEDAQEWVSSCGTSFTFNDDAPSDNDFHYCPNCSKPLEEHYHTVDPTDCDQTK